MDKILGSQNQKNNSAVANGLCLLFPEDFHDYALLDSGEGYRLEKWGEVILARPDPQAIWSKHFAGAWATAHAVFLAGGEGEKRWKLNRPLPQPWLVRYDNTQLLARLTPFKHTGIFAEQAVNWRWMMDILKLKNFASAKNTDKQNSKFKILNLFAYTGAATVILTKAGCFVTHVDSSKPSIGWAKENQKANGLAEDSIRWILDDAAKFVKREVKRGARYDGILMDPPAFGHSPTGKIWKFNEHLPALLRDCVSLLTLDARFLLVNGYATNSSAIALRNLLEDSLRGRAGNLEAGELCLRQQDGRLISTGIFSRWSPAR